ncbi:hypothetical protein HHL16_01135 [Pseudoflavitalea sp. G-6-1-2]|uniref:MbnP family protein n=1 Tax=Pseudoflavitalea sp. G-6-1-2 TaxID=2728841 RepID=UPI00146E6C2E|nr:MbnP family protein [Pseudoflavitalea sp. G-6-1-2]NML19451.1 hypothetical protein [Pseudoflavitalea sp. G-6-1-2]
MNQLHFSVQRIAYLLVCTLLFAACQKEANNKVEGLETNMTLHFTPVVKYDSVRMYFDTVSYENAFQERFTVKNFKFYIRSIRLSNAETGDAFQTSAEKYFLVNFKDTPTAEVKFGVLPSKYNRLSFIIGVDSATTVSATKAEALDPGKGMFWNDDAGYIFAKLEGTSPSSTASGKTFAYNIGGFKSSVDANKEIQLLFPYGKQVTMDANKSTTIEITADVYDWFRNPHDIKISQTPTCNTPGVLAAAVAENYSKMFTIMSVKNN